MSTLKSLFLTVIYLFQLVAKKESVIIGAWCEIQWGDKHKSNISHYISFSQEPSYESEMDNYGFPDDSVFAYSNKMDFLKRLWTLDEVYDYKVVGFSLNISDLLE